MEIAAAADVAGLRHEGSKSAPFYVLVLQTSETRAVLMGARPAVLVAKDGVRFAVEVLASGLDAPCSLAIAPDGRVFIAERMGRIRVWQSGSVLPDPSFVLNDVAVGDDVGLIGMTLHPDFVSNHQAFIAYTARLPRGNLVNRVVRLRETNNTFRASIVILEDAITEMPRRSPRIRFGPDRKLYVAFPTGNDVAVADDFASYSGKILRVNDDGTTPEDNPAYSPIILAGHPTPAAFDWQPTTGRLWVSERNLVTRDSPIDAVSAAFYTNGPIAGFRNQLFIAALAGEYVRRVTFDPADSKRAINTESLFERQFGRISDLVIGPDGAIYFSTSNRAAPTSASGVDLLVRLQ